MAISVVGVDLSKSVFQLSIAETRHLKPPLQPDALDAVDARHPPQPLPPHHRRRVVRIVGYILSFYHGGGPHIHQLWQTFSEQGGRVASLRDFF